MSTKPVKPRKSPPPTPLVCVYKPLQKITDPFTFDVIRVVFTAGICGAPSPYRLTGNRTLPQFPNRFGEPLCKKHSKHANDEHAFPGEGGTRAESEKLETHVRSMGKITGLLESGTRTTGGAP